MKILIYEDAGFKELYPLNLLRASFDILCGAGSTLDRIENIIKGKYETELSCRKELAPYLKEVHSNKINSVSNDDYLLLNGRVIYTADSIKQILSKKEKNSCFIYKDTIVAAFISKNKISDLKETIANGDGLITGKFLESLKLEKIILKENFPVDEIRYSWDVIDYIIHGGLEEDLEYFLNDPLNKKLQRIKSSDFIIDNKKVFVSKTAHISPGVIMDASQGRIIIDDKVTLEPLTFIKGPVYIGKNCLVKSGSKIYGPCIIGEGSKVSGEIAESVFHSFVNKQHDGFIGHSYICPFVNLGADTVTSDLKNNYSKIKMKIEETNIDTGMQFLGSLIGDHSKTSINTMLNTGSMLGIFSNLIGGGFHSKNIPSFTWNESGKETVKYDFEKAVETAKIVMERRGIKMTHSYFDLLKLYSNEQ